VEDLCVQFFSVDFEAAQTIFDECVTRRVFTQTAVDMSQSHR